jgi:hypothetical protein
MVQLRQKKVEQKCEYYIDSLFRIKLLPSSTTTTTTFTNFTLLHDYDTISEEEEQDIPDVTLDEDYIRYKKLPCQEYFEKMERLEKLQLRKLRQRSCSTNYSSSHDEINTIRLPFEPSSGTKEVVFQNTRSEKREEVIRRLGIKSQYITRLPGLKLICSKNSNSRSSSRMGTRRMKEEDVGLGLAFGCPIPSMIPSEFQFLF